MNPSPSLSSPPSAVTVWLRREERQSERRAPIVPSDARSLVGAGLRVVVEDSPQRAFAAADYQAAGCQIAEPGSWRQAPPEAFVVGIKELPDEPAQLVHRHIYFAHAYKGQQGARELLGRFAAGGGALLDVEYLLDERGRRLAAFGYWAGYVGAVLGVLALRGALPAPLAPATRAELDEAMRRADGPRTRAVVIGALGRSGRGACDALATAGAAVTAWDVEQTRSLDRPALLAHDVLVNTVLSTTPVPPFVRPEDVRDPARRLAVIADVSCDVTSECNVLPIYDRITTWDEPARRLAEDPVLDIIAIDNLPSLVPKEASEDFSAQLTPLLGLLAEPSALTRGPWARSLGFFTAAVAE